MLLNLLWVSADTQSTAALEQTTQLSQTLPQEIALTRVAYDDSKGLLPFYQQAQKLSASGPCLLLFEGESLPNTDVLKNHLDQGFTSLVYAQIHHPEHIELAPRLFFDDKALLEGCRFISEVNPPPEHVPLSLQAQAHCVYIQTFSPHQSEAAQQGNTDDYRFWKAYQDFKAMRDQEALAGFQALLTSPQSYWRYSAQVMYLKTLWETHEYQHCFEELERLRQEHEALENFPALWILRAVIAQQFQAIDTAFECFNMVDTLTDRGQFPLQHFFLERADITWKPLLGSAELALKEGLYPKAAQAFKQAAAYLPEHDYVLSGWLQSAFLTRRYDEVMQILAKDTPLRGISDLARESLQAMHHIKEASQQEATWEKLADIVEKDHTDPFVLSIWIELAILCLQHQHVALARQFLFHILKHQPQEVMLWHNLAYTYFAEQDYAHAEKYYRQALSVAPHYPNSQFDLAKTLVMQQRHTEAIQVLQQLLKEHPRFQEARKALQELEALEAFEAQAFLPTHHPQSKGLSLDDAPFVFAFPGLPTWENGVDLLLKAYYEEFSPSDRVVLAIPLTEHQSTEPLNAARDWALAHLEEDLLPPVALLEEALPLIPDLACWVIPWRVPPSTAFITALQAQTYACLAPRPLGDLTSFGEVDPDTRQAWQSVSIEELRQQLRLQLTQAREQTGPRTEPITQMASTHDFLPLTAAASNATHTPVKEAQISGGQHSLESLLSETPTLGVCMIVKNEAAVIKKALDSVRHEAQEIVVVDTGSTDGTLEILAQYPEVKVHHFTWCDDFSAARNAAFDKASTDWVLFLDADEYVESGFISRLRLTLNQHEGDAYCFKVVAVLPDGEIDPRHSLGGVPRLFPNQPEYRFEGRIHEVVYHQQKEALQYIYPKDLPIYHTGYRPEVIAAKDKLKRDRALMEQAIQENPAARSSKRLYGILAKDFWNTEEKEKAFHYLDLGLEQSHDDARVQEQLFYQQQHWRLAEGDIETVLNTLEASHNTSPRFLLLWGQVLAHQHRWAEAYDKLKAALHQWDAERIQPDPLDLRPALEEILSLLIDVCQALEKPDESFTYLSRYLKQVKNPDARFWQRYHHLLQQMAPLQF